MNLTCFDHNHKSEHPQMLRSCWLVTNYGTLKHDPLHFTTYTYQQTQLVGFFSTGAFLFYFTRCSTSVLLKPILFKKVTQSVQNPNLGLWPQNFEIVLESLAPNLEKIRQTSVWQTVPKFWFIWLCYISYFTVLL